MTRRAESAELTSDVLAGLKTEDRDLFLYSGTIAQEPVSDFFDVVLRKENKSKNASLILTTWGGLPGPAYRMARFLQNIYSTYRVTVFGPCKSAGTLVAVGANELAFGLLGELGPLDAQLSKSDEIVGTTSGIDTIRTLAIMRTEAFNAFVKYMIDLTKETKGAISMKTASDIAANLVTDLFQPMMQQIDPHRLSEVNRIMNITREYGKRLKMPNLKGNNKSQKERQLGYLIEGYPSHGFVIDKEEARSLFDKVLDVTSIEQNVMKLYYDIVTKPSEKTKIIDVEKALKKYFEDINGKSMLESKKENMGNGITKKQGGENEQRTSGESA